jgi:hypothetical protein
MTMKLAAYYVILDVVTTLLVVANVVVDAVLCLIPFSCL